MATGRASARGSRSPPGSERPEMFGRALDARGGFEERPEMIGRALDALREGNALLAARVSELHALALSSHAAAVRARACVLASCAERAHAAPLALCVREWRFAAHALAAVEEVRSRALRRAVALPGGERREPDALGRWLVFAADFGAETAVLAAARATALERCAEAHGAGRALRACVRWRCAAAELHGAATERAASDVRAQALRATDPEATELTSRPHTFTLEVSDEESDEQPRREVVIAEADALRAQGALRALGGCARLLGRSFRAWADLATLKLADRERLVSRELQVSVYALYECCSELQAERELLERGVDARMAGTFASKLIAQRRAESLSTSQPLSELGAQEAAVRRLASAALLFRQRGGGARVPVSPGAPRPYATPTPFAHSLAECAPATTAELRGGVGGSPGQRLRSTSLSQAGSPGYTSFYRHAHGAAGRARSPGASGGRARTRPASVAVLHVGQNS
ncbi:hypothetical protein T492DRAFT_880241 [Pavlovales sp. CCMP2436]|nr:hypothetical protein T492DRAFT_880241 [Pavlovales sp. CCMP2436]